METEAPDQPCPPSIGAEEVAKVLNGVFDGSDAAGLTRPAVADLAEGITDLRSFYEEVTIVNSFDQYTKWDGIYNAVISGAEKLLKALQQYDESWSATYFHEVCQIHDAFRSREDIFDPPEINATVLARRLITDFKLTSKQMDAEQRKDGGEFWYRHVEPSATAWLYGIGLPELFASSFGTDYRLPGEGGTSPAYRFAHVVCEVAGLRAYTSLSNMRRLESDHRARRVQRAGVPAAV